MKYRTLGKDLQVSAVSLGCMGMTHAYGAPSDEKEMMERIREAYETGYTMFDTAECYTGTNPDGTTAYNEELVGKALASIRDKVVIATKCGVFWDENGKMIRDSSPASIRKSIEGSLQKLKTDHIDLYYQHRIDENVSPEEVAETMKQLMQEGKITHWGISETNEEYLRRAHAVCPVTAIQNRYSMITREYESMFPVLEELNVGFVAFSPLANGFLSGAYTKADHFTDPLDFRSHMKQYTDEGFDAYAELLKMIGTIAEEKNVTPAAVSLAWMIDRKPYIVPIPGTRKSSRLKENASAADVNLTAEEITKMDNLLAQIQTA